MLHADDREDLIRELMDTRRAAVAPPRQSATAEQILAKAAYNPLTDSPNGAMRAIDYMKQLGESMDAIKEVLTFLSAQDAMDIFASNPEAATLHRRIISAGLAAIFQQRGNY